MFTFVALVLFIPEMVSTSVKLEKNFKVSQSQTLTDHVRHDADRAIDNDLHTCSKMIGRPQWWKATFQTEQNVSYVIIHKGTRDRLQAKVDVTQNDVKLHKCQQNMTLQNELFENYTCRHDPAGNGITIEHDGSAPGLVLCEVNIFILDEGATELQTKMKVSSTSSTSATPSSSSSVDPGYLIGMMTIAAYMLVKQSRL